MKNNDDFKERYGRNFEDITFSDLLKILKNLKLKVIWSILISLFSCSSLIFFLGMKSEASRTAIYLSDFFDIYIEKDEIKKCIEPSGNPGLNCKDLYLIKNPIGSIKTEKRHLEIRNFDRVSSMTEIVGAVLTKKHAGTVISTKNADKYRSFLPNTINISQPAIAQTRQGSFNWYGHKHNYDFREEYIDENTIRRYYSDGWILEYEVNRNRRSILSTFRWIRRGKCFLSICY